MHSLERAFPNHSPPAPLTQATARVTHMQTRVLGSSGITVGPIGLGCMGMSYAYDKAEQDDARSTAVLREAPSLGVTLIDTAPAYGVYGNESLIGAAFEGRRDEVVLATKCGLYPTGPDNSLVRDGRPESIIAGCDDSLRRLRVDVIDVFQLHRVDENVPVEESWGALAELKAAGKVRAIGISEATIDQVRAVHAISPIDVIQSELSLWTRQWVNDVLPWSSENGVAFLSYCPLGRGFLTGSMPVGTTFDKGDLRARSPRFTVEAIEANQAIVDVVREIAEAHDATSAQVALAWLLTVGPNVIPIPGTKRPERLRENAAAADLVLTASEVQRLNDLPAPAGERY